jgi:ABC-type multidrug transport system permease subunit
VNAPLLASSTAGWLTAGVLGFLLWLMCLIFLGIRTLRRGHWVMFLIGIVLPILWLIGALLPRRR